MYYYEFKIDEYLRFNSMHKIDYTWWKPRLKLLTDFDVILSENSVVYLKCNGESFVLNPYEAFTAHPGQSVNISEDSGPRAGVWIIHFCCSSYKMKALNDMTEISQFTGNILDSHFTIGRKIKLKNNAIFGILNRIHDEYRFKNYGHETALTILLVDLLHELHRYSMSDIISSKNEFHFSTVNSYARKTMEYLHNSYMKDISIKDITALLNLNYDYANALFKSVTGYTIMHYVDNIRLTRAKELIDTTTLKLSEIAQLVGLNDANYLSKKFRKREGISPSAYRKASG